MSACDMRNGQRYLTHRKKNSYFIDTFAQHFIRT